uniref:S5A_REDUCTASE domain-containing protein n=1 Tax=Syphacia muris TaxID=451379 RepID=A0A0N5AFI9_9BILA
MDSKSLTADSAMNLLSQWAILLQVIDYVSIVNVIKAILDQFSVSAHIAWFLFGIAVFPSALLALYGASLDYNSANFVIITLILVHYAYRSFIYAYSIKGGKRVPFHLFALGFCNNFFQGFLQSTWHFMFAFYPIDWINQLSSVIGLLLFATGMFIHVKSDGILQRLRRRHDKGYKLPRGFLFELITAPNYFGECVEWIGFAMFAWTLPALSHACFVIALLLPRALQYHRISVGNAAEAIQTLPKHPIRLFAYEEKNPSIKVH